MRFFLCTYMIGLLIVVGFSSCSDNTPLLKGRWEMFVGQDPTQQGQMDGVDDVTYSMELNFESRTFEPDNELPSGQKSYGWMDFSNATRIYHYDIDSVTVLGDNRYRIVSVDSWMNTSVDTLVYNPKTKEIVYGKDWIFKSVSTESAVSAENDGPSIFLMVLYFALALIVVIGAYYLFKIMLGYVLTALGFMLIGAAVGGIVLWILIGGFDLDLPQWAIITILAVPSVPMGIWGFWTAFGSTSEFISSPFASKIAKGMIEWEKKQPYVVDENGVKQYVEEFTDMSGRKTYTTGDGRVYEKNGDDTCTRIL